jgi:hypothetical protein
MPTTAWIEYVPDAPSGSLDWILYFKRQGRTARGKCQLSLLIESKLRAWLLEVCGLPLHTLSFDQLLLIAQGKECEAKRLHVRGHDTLMHRLEGAHCGRGG